MPKNRAFTVVSLLVLMAAPGYCQAPGTWIALTNKAPAAGTQPHLLSDGTVIWLHGSTPNWFRLTPDAQGSYSNGTWSTDLAPMGTPRLAFPSNLLPSGKLLVLGGEFSGTALVIDRVGTSEIYDPVANTWTPIANPPPVSNCPFVDAYGGALTKGSPVVSGMNPPGTPGFQAGWTVTGTGVSPGTAILSVDSADQITLSQNATLSGDYQLTLTTTNTGNIVQGSTIITGLANTAGYSRVSTISGNGIPAGALVTSVDSPSQIHISLAATSSATAVALTIGIRYEPPICIGDSPTMVLPNGKILVGGLTNLNPEYTFLYDPATNTWSPGPAKVYDNSAEQSWVQLDHGSVLTYDVYKTSNSGKAYAEIYNAATNKWSSISPADGTANGTLPIVTSNALGIEIGPILRLQDGRAFVLGANGHTALYTPSTNTWEAGPDVVGTLGGSPYVFGLDDNMAAILPNGHVIFEADISIGIAATGNLTSGSTVVTGVPSTITAMLQPYMNVLGNGITEGTRIASVSPGQVTLSAAATATALAVSLTFGSEGSAPHEIFDFDPVAGTISPMAPSVPDPQAQFGSAHFLMLPTGQLLYGAGSSQMWIYTPTGGPSPNLLPTITSVANGSGGVYTLTGTQLSGQNAGAAYGDDQEADENFPVIRLASSTGRVYYARTFNWSSTLVGLSATPQTVNFTLPAGIPTGTYSLIVSAAGISSNPYTFSVTGTTNITSVSTASGGLDIAQNTFIVIKGSNLVPNDTPAAGVIWSTAPSFASGQMPTQLGGVSVTVNGNPAFIYFFCSAATSQVCASDQINVLTPLDNITGPVSIVVTSAGSSGTTVSPAYTANMKTVAPTFLLFGSSNYVAATRSNNTLIGPTTLYPGASTPAKPGETLVLYAVGFGLPSGTLTNGSSSQSGALPALPVCKVGNNTASVVFAGLIAPGLYQLNLAIPANTPNADVAIGCTYGGAATPSGDLITVHN